MCCLGYTVIVVMSLLNSLKAEVSVSLNKRHYFVLSGTGESLQELELMSAGGGIRPIGTRPGESGNNTRDLNSGPFSAVLENNINRVHWLASGGELQLDGIAVLGAGWDESSGFQDLAFHYQDSNGNSLPVKLERGFYDVELCQQCFEPFSPSMYPRMELSISESNHLTLRGERFPITSLRVYFEPDSVTTTANMNPAPCRIGRAICPWDRVSCEGSYVLLR